MGTHETSLNAAIAHENVGVRQLLEMGILVHWCDSSLVLIPLLELVPVPLVHQFRE